MITPMHLPKILAIHMRVDLRGRDVRVSKHLLYRSQIRAAFQQMGRERVPQRMRVDVLRDPGPFDVLAQDLPGTHARQRLAARVQKQRTARLAMLERPSLFANVNGERGDCASTNGDEP